MSPTLTRYDKLNDMINLMNLRVFYNNTYYYFVVITSYKDASFSVDVSKYGYEGMFTPKGVVIVERTNKKGKWKFWFVTEQY